MRVHLGGRRRRTTATVIVIVGLVLGGCAWQHPRSDLGATGSNPFETTIAAANVGSLAEQFRLPSSQTTDAPVVVVARGHAYVGGSDSVPGTAVRVFDAIGATGCSGTPRTCTPQWSLDGGGTPDVYGTTLYRGGNAYDADGVTNCSGAPKVCGKVWQEGIGSAPPGPTDPARLHFEMHESFSGSLASEEWSVYGYDTTCPPIPADCPLRWAHSIGGGRAGAPPGGPVVEGTRVFASYRAVNQTTGTIYAFDGTHGSAPLLWSASTTGGVRAVGEGVLVAAGPVYVGSIGVGSQLVMFDAAGAANCSGSPAVCTPLWFTDTWQGSGFEQAPAIANGVLYRTTGGRLAAYDLHGNGPCTGALKVCTPLWDASSTADFTAPTVAGGLVFVGDATGTIRAYDAHGANGCSATTRHCAPLWTASVGVATGPPVVSGGRVYVPAVDGVVHVFALPS